MTRYYKYEDTVISLDNIISIKKNDFLYDDFKNSHRVYYYLTTIKVRYNNDYEISLGVTNTEANEIAEANHNLGDRIYNEICSFVMNVAE